MPLCIAAGAQERVCDPSSAASTGLSQEDWGGIRLAQEQGQHRVRENGAGFEASNPGQRWVTSFDKRGFSTEPNGGAWSWGLQLGSYGFTGSLIEVDSPGSTSFMGSRVTYDWDSNLQEWYVNDSRGLEHGYTLQARPQGSQAGPLMFEIAVRGGLRARALAGGLGAEFLDAAGHQVLTYSGLFVFDANGVAQEALITCTNSGLRIEVNEQDATYPLTVDPVAFQSYVKASNTDPEDRFGAVVAAFGDRVVVGAPGEDSASAGVDGDESDNSLSNSGAVYVFVLSAGQWVQEAYLKASNPDADDAFGASVAISSEIIVVGTPNESSSATAINGNGLDNGAALAGAAYVFERVGGQWVQTAYLKADNAEEQDGFGFSVATHSGRVLVGANKEDSNSSDLNGDGADNSFPDSGAAYLFEKTPLGWIQSVYLKAPNSGTADQFGAAVGITEDRLAVGAPFEDSNGVGINGEMDNDSASASGAVYSFGRVGSQWVFDAYIKALNPGLGDAFGWGVALSGDRMAVGAPHESGSGAGVNSNSSLNDFPAAGAAYVFLRVGGLWFQEAYLKATNPKRQIRYGQTLAMHGDHVIVGSLRDVSQASGINGSQNVEGSNASGSAYIYAYTQGAWEVEAFIKSANPEIGDDFGAGVAMSESMFFVGAPREDSGSQGMGGDPLDNSAQNSGALFTYLVDAPFGSYCDTSIPNSSGNSATITVSGSTVLADQSFSLQAIGLPSNQFGYFLSSQGQGIVLAPGGSQGILCLGGGSEIFRHNRSWEIGFSGPAGSLQVSLDLADIPIHGAALVGDVWNFQCWYRDQNPIHDSNFTNAVSVRFD